VLYPLTFRPIFKERVWGGRNLQRLFAKDLPPTAPIGESWEISDRPGNVSVIANGPLAGKNLRWFMELHATDLLGKAGSLSGRFPLLIKLLDAQDTLSLQVHPPASKAAQLGGEPKTEMWYIAEASPGAQLLAGLKRGITRQEFERRIQDGSVAQCFHRLPVSNGDALFLPSGRVHALGKGLVLFEIQQNSDTTYRVFDWNRLGLDGKPRDLHIEESLACIDFDDFEPGLVQSSFTNEGPIRRRFLVKDPLFTVEEVRLAKGCSDLLQQGEMHILGCLSGRLHVTGGGLTTMLSPGAFCLVPACLLEAMVFAESESAFLRVEAGK
jgi:mannose-6-phosphate isomerase